MKVSSKKDKRVALGPLSVATWQRVDDVRAMQTGEWEAWEGFLQRPVTNDEEGLTAKEFDRLYKRPARCESACSSAVSAARSFRIVDEDDEFVQYPALEFSVSKCVDSCLIKGAYLKCLRRKVSKKKDQLDRYKGLKYCEARR